MNWLAALGLFGGLMFALAAVPQAVKTLSVRRHLGTPPSISMLILAGTFVMYAYLHLSYGFDWVIAVNYSVEAASWAVLLFYGIFGRSQEKKDE